VSAPKTLAAIEAGVIATTEQGHRNHLGASVIGRPCSRELWYIFRWVKTESFEARMLRLFDRGDREEDWFDYLLNEAGFETWTQDYNGKQFRCIDVYGHFGGSLDGVAKGIPDIPEGLACLLELKTHNDKSFKKLKTEGLVNAKYEHYVQIQIYLYKFELQYALYMAVNKNDDHLFLDVVKADNNVAIQHIQRAHDIIFSKLPPKRINESSAWWQCKFCHLRNICHNITDEKAEVNCRTCQFSQPVDNAQNLIQ